MLTGGFWVNRETAGKRRKLGDAGYATMVRPPSSADESSVASSTNVLRAGDPRGRTYSSGLKLRKDDPQRMEAWKSAAETLRKAATVGVSGAQVDAFGKPVGFSKSVHRALRPKKVYNRAPNDDAPRGTLCSRPRR